MSGMVVLSNAGLKAAVAAAVGADGWGRIPVTFLCVGIGAEPARRRLAALERLCQSWPQARCVQFTWTAASDGSEGEGQRCAKPGTRARWQPDAEPDGPGGSLGVLPALLSMGVQLAARTAGERIITGLSQAADEAQLGVPYDQGRPDRRREFLHAYNCMLATALPASRCIHVEAPLMDECYADIVRLGQRFEVPFEHTWSCETQSARGCGRCESCRARYDGFRAASMPDPLLLEATAAAVST